MSKIIAFQGFLGAYSDLSCRQMFPDAQTLPCNTFDKAFAAVQEGRADLAMIPVDNTLAGRVADVHRLMPESGLHIIGEHFQPIQHALMGIKGAKLEDIKTVHSHIHALPQCQSVIKELELEQKVHADTAGAAQEIAKLNDPTQAAIASALAAEIYGLEILREDVQDADHNTTRFLVLSKDYIVPKYEAGTNYITSFIFDVRNIPAALYKALGGFATNGINMVKLESYVDENFQAAQFYADVIGHPEDRPLQLAMEELGFFAKDVLPLGTYKAHPFRKI
ncbi:MAG TPA: prephenate dehydratase [Alphaproteobacteria bacterium]|nr:prephenate dehydratase [Alphaproteobacteria bacterium]